MTRPGEAVRRDDGTGGTGGAPCTPGEAADEPGLDPPVQRRRAVLRRHHRHVHRHAGAGLRLRHHPVRDAVHERPVVREQSARPARGQPRQRRPHLHGSRDRLGRPPASAPAPASTWVPLAKFNRYSYGKVARFMQKLDALGALENTLIYASSDMGNPAQHSTRNVPTRARGRRQRQVPDGPPPQGRRRLPASAPWCAPGDKDFVGVTNNKILVAIAQAFGITDVNSFGTQSNSRLDHRRAAESDLAPRAAGRRRCAEAIPSNRGDESRARPSGAAAAEGDGAGEGDQGEAGDDSEIGRARRSRRDRASAAARRRGSRGGRPRRRRSWGRAAIRRAEPRGCAPDGGNIAPESIHSGISATLMTAW